MDRRREWLLNAAAAGLLPFELVDPVPETSWVAGNGGGSDGSLHIDIMFVVDGREIAVGTALGGSHEDGTAANRRTVLQAMESALDDPLTFPATVSLTIDERRIEVSVDGVPTMFSGIVIAGHDDFTLGARVDANTTVTIYSPTGLMPAAIRRRDDLAIPGFLPPTRACGERPPWC